METLSRQTIQPAPAPQQPVATPSSLGTPNLDVFRGRAIRVITTTPSVLGEFFSSVDGTDKVMKIATSIMLIFQLKVGAELVPTLVQLRSRLNEASKFLKVRRFTGTLEYFAHEKFNKDKIINVASMSLLMVSNTCEQLMWMGSMGILKLGQIASSVGRIPGCQFVSGLAIRNVHMAFGISGVGLAALHYFLMTAEPGQDQTKCWIKVADNVSKAACIILSGWAMTYGYAALCIVSACLGLCAIWYREHGAEMKEQAPPAPNLAEDLAVAHA